MWHLSAWTERKKYASVYASTYQEAKAKQIEHMSNCCPHPPAGLNSKLEDVMWSWLASTVNTVKPSTFLKYDSVIRNHITNGLGNLQLQFISSQTIDQFATEKLQR